MKTHHMGHHFNDAESGYGVSSKLWDVVFRTLFVAKNREKITE
jgi:sterol desaturase/sphingolipid hydroxylase (fatty acid hydroxylase superfamily)